MQLNFAIKATISASTRTHISFATINTVEQLTSHERLWQSSIVQQLQATKSGTGLAVYNDADQLYMKLQRFTISLNSQLPHSNA